MVDNEHVFFWATVESVSPLTVRRDGETEPLGAGPSSLVDLSRVTVGMRVWCQLQHRRALIIGVAGGVPPPELVGPWLPITSIRSSWTRYATTWACDARKSPGGVQLSAVIKPDSGAPGTLSETGMTILTLPTELRPPSGIRTTNALIYAVVYGTAELEPFRITENGDLINLRTITKNRANWIRFHGEVFY